MPQLARRHSTLPVGLGPIQRTLVCGLANIEDQVECSGKAFTVSHTQESSMVLGLLFGVGFKEVGVFP